MKKDKPRRSAGGAKAAPTNKGGRGPGRPTLSNEELLDKALDLFLEEGFERTSIDAITAAAGMAKRTVYLRYGDKKSLFKAALQRAIEEWIVPIEELRAAECDDLEETLLNIGRILLANIMSPGGIRLLRITNAESGRLPEIGAFTYQRGTERTIDYLADLVQRRLGSSVNQQECNEAAIAFLYLVVCGPPTMTAWGMTLDDEAVANHTSFCVRLFLYGLLPREMAAGEREDRVRHAHGGGLSAGEQAQDEESGDVGALQDENRRLRKLLVASMLEVASLKERANGT